MGFVVEFDSCDNSCVFQAHYQIKAHSVDSVVPLVEMETLFHSGNAGQLDLSQDDVFRQRRDKTVVEHLLGLSERLLWVERPRRFVTSGHVSCVV